MGITVDSLKLLESKVEEILSRNGSLGQERDELRQKLAQAQAQVESMTERLAAAEREREEVRGRIDALLERLADLEV